MTKGVLGVEEVEDGAVAADDVFDEADGLFEHGLAEVVVEGGEAAAVDGVVGFEAAEVEPVAGELGGEAAGAGVGEHAAGFGGEGGGIGAEVAGGASEELAVGHAGPEEVAEAAGERGAGERGARGRSGGSGRGGRVEAVAELGRDEDADEGVADGLFVGEGVFFAELGVVADDAFALGGGKRAAVGAGGEGEEGVDVFGLGLAAELLDGAQGFVDHLE